MTTPDNSYFCCYCGERFSENKGKHKTVDHLIPLSKGGSNNFYNKRNCCQRCNTQKGSIMLHDWLPKLKFELLSKKLSCSQIYKHDIQIENVKYWIDYTSTAGDKIFRNKERYLWFQRRYLKELQTA